VTQVDHAFTCPQDGAAATELRFAGQASAFNFAVVRVGGPVRSFGHYGFGLTTLLGDTYLGRSQGASALVPIAGPLRPGDGVAFEYLDSVGAVTTTPTNVRQIVLTVRAGNGVLNSLGEMVADSLRSTIYVRN